MSGAVVLRQGGLTLQGIWHIWKPVGLSSQGVGWDAAVGIQWVEARVQLNVL